MLWNLLIIICCGKSYNINFKQRSCNEWPYLNKVIHILKLILFYLTCRNYKNFIFTLLKFDLIPEKLIQIKVKIN